MSTKIYMNLRLPTKLNTVSMEYNHEVVKCEVLRIDFQNNTMKIRFENGDKGYRTQNVDATAFINNFVKKVRA